MNNLELNKNTNYVINFILMGSHYLAEKNKFNWEEYAIRFSNREIKVPKNQSIQLSIDIEDFRKIKKDIQNNKRNLSTISLYKKEQGTIEDIFKERVLVLPTREGKEKIYSQLFKTVKNYLGCQKIKYLGLPEMQSLEIIRQFGTKDVFIFERDSEKYEIIQLILKSFNKLLPERIYNSDILDAYKFEQILNINLYDLDLMCCINTRDTLGRIVNLIDKTMQKIAVIHVTTLVRFKGGDIKYNSIVNIDNFGKEFNNKNIKILDFIKDEYCDSSPMRSIILVIERK